ncbi:TPA: hypothetical protein KD131_003082 [Vibrio parahaemolyticus]|uniref:hypothetical protein n=1 Tax=Vibrio TaxID=662 RepID=UPI001B814444|nr:hypothetical protein [Vibrio parahaemolyticus]EJG0697533.1 hypothetical protein [Vibrio parahaemolyticus]ELA9713010.1 hypothetical protein [Vibrio parahaemolyticus]ELA9726518.1 hypothetical protein [Vibrio parahaemolyticus]MDV5082438.1 hypothetical protein [Vibrio parahaemolyticus]HBC3611121.1 hypothetical protein [Vibrio parahaemolyticus]
MRFRPAKGGFAEAIAEAKDFTTHEELLEFVNQNNACGHREKHIKLSYQGFDKRWGESYIVTCKHGVLGYTDGNFD